jgi:hypothetical protein
MSATSRGFERFGRVFAVTALIWSLGAALQTPHASAQADVSFYISDAISDEDEMYIREGVRFAQDFLAKELDVDLDAGIIINAMPAPPRGDSGTVGVFTGRAITYYTGSEGWMLSAPFERVQIVVHEFVHFMQEVLVDGGEPGPLWIDEGIADYLGYQAVIDAGWVSAEDVEQYQLSTVVYGPALPKLEDVEDPDSYQNEPAAIYGLASLAIERLVDGDLHRVANYYNRLGAGADWKAAFRTSFKIAPDTFYDEFETARADFTASYDYPLAFSFYAADVMEYPAPVSLESLPARIKRGNQLIIIAHSDPWISCDLQVSTRAKRTLVDDPSYADPTGRVIWLWTIPEDSPGARVTAEISCGGEIVEEPFQIT